MSPERSEGEAAFLPAMLVILLVLAVGWAIAMTVTRARIAEQLERERARFRELAAFREEATSAQTDAPPPEASPPSDPDSTPPAPEPTPGAPEEARLLAYDFDEFPDRLLQGDPDLQGLITPAHIEETLEAHGRTAELLVAAAFLSDDPEAAFRSLEEALEIDPTSPGALAAMIGARVTRGEIDRGEIERLQQVDPGNALADYYDALARFQEGDPEAALEAMRNAVGKSRLTNYGLGSLTPLEIFYLDAGCADGVARSLAAFRLPLEYICPLRDLNTRVLDQVDEAMARGDYEAALAMTRDTAYLGNTMASSSRYMLSDLLGMAFRGQVMEKEIEIYRALGRPAEVERLETLLARDGERKERLRRVAGLLPEIASEFSEDELLEYLQRVITLGEDGALIGLPDLRERLHQTD